MIFKFQRNPDLGEGARPDATEVAQMRALYDGAVRAVVITAVGRAPDVMRHGVNGFVVPPDDEAGLTDALRQLLESSELRRQFSAASREMASDFSAETMVAPLAS